jgi:alpha-glucosidase (family GH31 glycosyl hydrolase)
MMVSVGGIGDVYFIVDSDPNNVAGAYLEIVGKPVLIPQWALGWHQCKWGYLTL